jgi:hypothetical protein
VRRAWVLAGSLEGFSGGDQARLGEFESRARVMAGVYRPKKSRAGLPFTVFRVPFSLTCGSRLKELWRGPGIFQTEIVPPHGLHGSLRPQILSFFNLFFTKK